MNFVSTDTSGYIKVKIDLRGGPMDGWEIESGDGKIFRDGNPPELKMYAFPIEGKEYPHAVLVYQKSKIENGRLIYRFARYEAVP